MTFETTLEPGGYQRVLLHLAARRLRFAPMAVAIVGMLAYGSGLRTEALGMFAALLAIPIVLWGYLSWLARSPSARALYAPVRYTLAADRLVYESVEGDGEVAWSEFVRWREAAAHVLLYLTTTRYLVIPLEGLDDDVRDQLAELLGEKLGPPRGKLTSLR